MTKEQLVELTTQARDAHAAYITAQKACSLGAITLCELMEVRATHNRLDRMLRRETKAHYRTIEKDLKAKYQTV